MRLHYLQHAPYEGPANVELWANKKSHEISGTKLYSGEKLPGLGEFDWLVVMGGPMNVYEEAIYPWLAEEKMLIRHAIDEGKIVLGICLGAQLIADVLGGKVSRNPHQEIGWLDVSLTDEGKISPIFSGLPECFTTFQWHGDTFSTPPGANRLAFSEACANQAFSYKKAVATQFHLEPAVYSIEALIEYCGEFVKEGGYVQGIDKIRMGYRRLAGIEHLLDVMLDNMEKEFTINH